jgi:hypothetical protein
LTQGSRAKALNEAIQDAINKLVELLKLSPYSKWWWSSALSKEKKQRQQLAGRAKYHWVSPDHPIHNKYHQQHNQYSEKIWQAKAKHWIEWLEGLDETNVWQVSRLVTSPLTDAGKVRIPTLQVKDPTMKKVIREAPDNTTKGQLFYDTFFPPTNPVLTPPLDDYWYPPPQSKFQNITDEQVHRAILKMKLLKASRSGTVPNSVLTYAREDLIPHLAPLFHTTATNTLNYYPQEWSLTETLILKKPEKPDYTSPSAWWLIVLSDGMARLLNSCQTEDIVMMCEKYNLLPANHLVPDQDELQQTPYTCSSISGLVCNRLWLWLPHLEAKNRTEPDLKTLYLLLQ